MTETLIHIGYGKAGSTLLQHWFRSHPELFVGDGWDLCRSFYKDLGVANRLKYFVISSEGLGSWLPHKEIECEFDLGFDVKKYQLKICKILKHWFAESKILVITRNFEDQIKSGYSQYVKQGGDLGLIEYLNKYGHLFLKLYDVNYLIELYVNFFGEQNVIVMPYELLKDNPESFFSHIDNELSLDYFRIPSKKFNPSLAKEEMHCYTVISKCVASICNELPSYEGIRVYKKHIHFLRHGKYKLLVSLMKLFIDKKTDMQSILPDDFLSASKKKYTILNNYKLYDSFRDKYFLVN